LLTVIHTPQANGIAIAVHAAIRSVVLLAAVFTGAGCSATAGRPPLLAEFIARNDLSRALQQEPEHLKRLIRQMDADSLLPELARTRTGIYLE
jgi:hypothetical protein